MDKEFDSLLFIKRVLDSTKKEDYPKYVKMVDGLWHSDCKKEELFGILDWEEWVVMGAWNTYIEYIKKKYGKECKVDD
jgi:hypothetical protein